MIALMTKAFCLQRLLLLAIIFPIAAVGLSGCGTPMVETTVYDFILELPKADRGFDQTVIDMANIEDYRFLGQGWHFPENGVASSIIWVGAETADIHFSCDRPVDSEILLNVRPIVFEGSPTMRLTLELNTHPIGEITLSSEWQVYRVTVGAALLNPGDNQFKIHHSHLFRPIDVWEYSTDERQLAASYRFLVIRPEKEPLPPGNYTLQQVLGAKDFYFKGLLCHIIHDQPSAAFSYHVTLPSRPVLSFHSGILPETVNETGENAEFTISVRTKGSTTPNKIWIASVRPPKRNLEMGWMEHRRDLKKYANQEVDIIFETSSNDPDAVSNQGSWLEPRILNRHRPVNIVLLPGSGPNWPPTVNPDGISPLSVLAQKAKIIRNFQSVWSDDHSAPAGESTVSSSMNERCVLPMEWIRRCRSEGWQAGYFFTGRNQAALEAAYHSEFDALAGSSESTDEDVARIESECMDWIKRLQNDNFILGFDPFIPDDTSDKAGIFLERFVGKLLDHQFDRDSIFIVYNAESGHDLWFFEPKRAHADEGIESKTDWKKLSDRLYQFLEI